MLASSRYKKTGTAGFFMSPHSLKNSDYDCLWLPSQGVSDALYGFSIFKSPIAIGKPYAELRGGA
jgi:hypothetical protein